jgi:hypothetical protein
MFIPIFRSAAEHAETREELDRANERDRRFGRPTRSQPDPNRRSCEPRYDFGPIDSPDGPPHAVIEAPDGSDPPGSRRGFPLLFARAPDGGCTPLSAREALEAARQFRHGMRVAEPPAALTVHVAAVAAGAASGAASA